MPILRLSGLSRTVVRSCIAAVLVLVAGISCTEVTGPEDSAASLTVVAGDNQAGRVSSQLDDPIVVRVTDRGGKGVRGAALLFRADSGSGATDPLVATTDSTGVASVRWRLGATLGEMRLTVSFADLNPATVTATAVPDRISIVSGDLQAARVTGTLAQPLVVRVTDFLGRTVPGVSVAFTPDGGDGTVAPALIATDAQGLARTNWTLGASAGAMRLVASVSTASPVEFSAVASQDVLTLASGGDQGARAGTLLPRPVQVRVTDQNGQAIPNVIVTFEPGTGSGSVSPVSAQSNAQGLASTNWTLGATAGSQTLAVRSSFASSVSVSASALLPSDILVVSGNQQVSRVSTSLPSDLVVLVTDTEGRRVPGAQVRFVPEAGSGVADPTLVTTDTLGQARTRWTLGTSVGLMRLRAIAGVDTLVFLATTTADLLTVTAGDNQTGRFGVALGTPLSVTARDIAGNTVGGVVVTFTPDIGSGAVSPSSVTTDASGVARTLWTLGGTPGAMRVVASATTAAQPVEIRATATGDLLSVVSGGGQSAAAGAPLSAPVVMQVRRADGTAVSGVTLTFAPSAGSVSATTATTDANGRAQTAWTLGAASGAQTLTVTSATTLPVALTATARTASTLAITAGNAQAGRFGNTLGNPIVVTVLDDDNQPVSGIAVTFSPDAGSGTTSATTVATNALGRAQVTWVLGAPPGTMRLQVSADGLLPRFVTATATGDNLTVSSGGGQSAAAGAALPAPVVMQVRRADGTPVSGVLLTFAPDDGTVSRDTATTDASGRAQTTWTLGVAAGAQSLRVTSGSTLPTTVTATARKAATLSVTSGSGQTARFGSALAAPVVVTLTDLDGSPVAGAEVTFAPAIGNGAVSAGTVTTDASGRASVSWTLGGPPGAMSLKIGATGAASLTASATATGDNLSVLMGTNQAAAPNAALPEPVVMEVRRADGTPVSGVVVTFAPDGGSGTVATQTVTTDVAGRAQTLWTLGATTGTQTLRVTSDATLSTTVTATARTAATLLIASGNGQTARFGTALATPIRATVLSTSGAPVAGVAVTFTPAVGNGAVAPTTVTTDANGNAQTTWTLGALPGTMSLTVAASGVPAQTVTAAATGDSIVVESGNGLSSLVGTELRAPVRVRLANGSGAALSNALVTFTPTTGSGTVSADTVRTDSFGRAQVAWTLGPVRGPMALNVTTATTLAQAVNATALAADSIALITTGALSGFVGTALDSTVRVRVSDRTGTVVPGVSVSFAPSAGSVSAASVTTDASGIATVRWTLGTVPGPQTLAASLGASPAVNVSALAIVDSSRVMSVQAGNGQSTLPRSALGTELTVRVLDRFGNRVQGQAIGWSGTNVSLAAATSTTNASGDATMNVTTGTTAGTSSVTATVAGRTESTTFSVTTQVNLTSVWAGDFHSCGIDEGGTAYCWGFNQQGQLGTATVTADMTNAMGAPVTVGSQAPRFRKISSQGIDACGVTLESQLICWGAGQGNFGQPTPERVTFAGYNTIEEVAVGSNFACVVAAGGATWCFGDGAYGQMGDGAFTDNTSGVSLLTSLSSKVDAGLLHACAFARGTTTLNCWGYNFNGELGDGSTTNRNVPVPVSGAIVWDTTSLAVGGNHTCALDSTGAAYCWGNNAYGQVGDGTTGTNRLAPTAVAGGFTFASLYAGRDYTCGITAAGAAYCWGRNTAGQLGDGGRLTQSTPKLVGGGLTFRSLSLGELHSCGVAAAANGAGSTLATPGTVYCWGDGEKGQAGNGTFRANNAPLLTPTRVSHQP